MNHFLKYAVGCRMSSRVDFAINILFQGLEERTGGEKEEKEKKKQSRDFR